MSLPKATVIQAANSPEESTPNEGPRVTQLGTGSEPDIGSPKITQSDNDSFDALMDAVQKDHPSKEGDAPAKVEGAPKINIAEKRPPAQDPASKTLSSSKDVKPPTTPKEKPAEKPAEPEPAAEQKPPAAEAKPAEAPAKPQPVPDQKPPQDPEIDGIAKPRNLSPQNDSNWETLRAISKKYKAEAIQAKQIAEQLQKESGKLNPDLEKEVNQLREMRRRFDLQNDPHFVENFDKPMKDRNDQLYGILKQCGMPEDRVKKIEENGGPLSHPMSWWEEEIIGKLKESQNPQEQTAAIIVKNLLEKNIQSAFEREKEVAKAASGQADWLKERVAQMDKSRKEEQDYITQRLNQVQKEVPWANPQQIPADATPEQKAAIEKHNQFYAATVERLKVALSPRNPQEKVETALAACMAFKLNEDLAAAESKIAQLTEQLSKYKAAGQTSSAGKAAPSTPAKPHTFGQLVAMKNEDAIEKAMQEAGL